MKHPIYILTLGYFLVHEVALEVETLSCTRDYTKSSFEKVLNGFSKTIFEILHQLILFYLFQILFCYFNVCKFVFNDVNYVNIEIF